MKKFLILSLTAAVFAIFGAVAWAEGGDILVKRQQVKEFAMLPEGVNFPEGIAANPETGQIYVSTFDFEGNNKLLRFGKNGKLEAQKDFESTPLLGLAFKPGNGDDEADQVYIANFGSSQIQRIAADFDGETPVETVAEMPSIGAPADRFEGNPDGSQDIISFGNNIPAPNALIFNAEGDLFVSDSFQGAIFKIDDAAACASATPCPVQTVTHDGLLATAGFPPFGANGLALSSDELTLFVANTGDDRVLRVNLASGAVTVFTESINGADGLAYDDQGRLWVAANQGDELVALDIDNGRVIAKYGDFLGIKNDGTARGLLFPASLVIVRDRIFVTNLALSLTAEPGDEAEESVSRYTISEVNISGR